MSYITVPHTCPYIGDVLRSLDIIYTELEPLDREGSELASIARAEAVNATNIMEDIRHMNAQLREEGEEACAEAEMLESEVEELQDMLASAEERATALEEKLFDIENEREEEEWQTFLSTQRNLLTVSS